MHAAVARRQKQRNASARSAARRSPAEALPTGATSAISCRDRAISCRSSLRHIASCRSRSRAKPAQRFHAIKGGCRRLRSARRHAACIAFMQIMVRWVRAWLFGIVSLPASCADERPEERLLDAYAACGDDVAGQCREQDTMRCSAFNGEDICLLRCSADTDCPPHPQGIPVICHAYECVPNVCLGPIRTASVPEWACIEGTFRRCSELPDPPCSQCSPCPAGSYCDQDETCAPKLDAGAPCASGTTCRSGECTGSVCQLSIGSPCTTGDPCALCMSGVCTRECAIRSGDISGECPLDERGTACSADLGERDDGDSSTLAGYCHFRCDGNDTTCPEGMSCVVPAGYFSITQVRVCVP